MPDVLTGPHREGFQRQPYLNAHTIAASESTRVRLIEWRSRAACFDGSCANAHLPLAREIRAQAVDNGIKGNGRTCSRFQSQGLPHTGSSPETNELW